ncbi:hypothetical protein QTP70_017618, partial [Hemibagrus guttatus]
GIKAGYTLDGVPTHRRAHTPLIHSHNHTLRTKRYQSTYNACLWTGGGNRGYPEETPEARGEHGKHHTHTRRRRESNPKPWRCEANGMKN